MATRAELQGTVLRTIRKAAKRIREHDRFRNWRAACARQRSNATFIAVTGSSGKSTTTALISHILLGVVPVRTRLGRSLADSHVESLLEKEPLTYYVGEIGALGPGTLQPAIDVIRPSVGVITLVALEHKSAFRTIEAVAEEKGKLVEALPGDGLAVLNHDDPRVLAMARRTRARVVTFGQSGGDYVVANLRCEAPGDLRLNIIHQGRNFKIASRLTGTHQVVAVAAAFACAHQLGVPAETIIGQIESFEPLFGRCSVHRIANGPVFILDTVKAPYHSVRLAIEMMAGFSAPRKRVVLGHVSDAAGSDQIYPRLYKAARMVADQVIFVGEHSHRSKARTEDIAKQRFVEKRSVEEAAKFVKQTSVPGELILVKSSQTLHLERIQLNFGTEVRCWIDNCGRLDTCIDVEGQGCGEHGKPFEHHKGKKNPIAAVRWSLL